MAPFRAAAMVYNTVISGPFMRIRVISEPQQTGKAKHVQFLGKTLPLTEYLLYI
jgi:hypothetical protein